MVPGASRRARQRRNTSRARSDSRAARVLRRTIELDEHAALALGARGSAQLAFVAAEPIFDDFGDVFAALIAHRSLRSREPTLEDGTN